MQNDKNYLKIEKIRPRRDSNPQSSDPKSDALSIRPRGPTGYGVLYSQVKYDKKLNYYQTFV